MLLWKLTEPFQEDKTLCTILGAAAGPSPNPPVLQHWGEKKEGGAEEMEMLCSWNIRTGFAC